MAPQTIKTTFPGSRGAELAARLDLPTGTPRAFALFAHCFTCGKDIAAATRISTGLREEGFAVLRFDFTGLGSSEGEFANTDFSSNIADLVAAADMLRARFTPPRLLIGHSLGGAAVLAAASRIPEVNAVATIAAPADPSHVSDLFDPADLEAIEHDGVAEVSLAGRPFTVRREFLRDIAGHNLAASVAALNRALLVMHSPRDTLVGVENARQIFDAAKHPKSFVSLDDADHLLTNREHAAYAARVLAAWASRFVDDDAESPAPPQEGHVIVEEADVGRLAQMIRAGRHTLRADEPAGIGDDTGPTPYDLLLAALGACTSMTIRMYAERKEISLEHVRVTLTHERRHAEDCEDADGKPLRIDVIGRTLELAGDLSGDDVERLLSIADRCPVHRTLDGDIRIETSVAGTK
jgi:putative redox protein